MKRANFIFAAFFLLCQHAMAALPDEFAVYSDEMNPAGKAALELNINSTPSGIKTPSYPGEIVADRGIRVTPEISYGLSDILEGGIYLPAATSANGSLYLPGARVKLKWMPVKKAVFFGANIEASSISRKFQSDDSLELRMIAGARKEGWLIALNPTLTWGLHAMQKSPELSLAARISREISAKTELGLEYYTDFGASSSVLPDSMRPSILFAVVDHDWKSFSLNFGIGSGLNGASDRWTVKSTISFAY